MENTAYVKPKARGRNTTRMLCEGAIMVALALVLGLTSKVFELPQGGSISLEMLPLFVFCVRWGMGSGFIACFAFSILQIFVQGAVTWGWQSIILDYILAFGVIGVAGLGHGHKYGIFWGSLLGAAARFIIHFISGITIYRILVPTEVLGTVFDDPTLYSIVYNGSYMLPNTILALVIAGLLYVPLKKFYVGADIPKA